MKQINSLAYFLITLLLITQLSSSKLKTKKASLNNNLKSKSKSKTNTNQVSIDQIQSIWSDLFGSSVRSSSCLAAAVSADPSLNVDPSLAATTTQKSGWGAVQPSFSWVKKFGYGPLAYLFDYIDSIFQQDFITETNRIFHDIDYISKNDTDSSTDAFKMSMLMPNGTDPTCDADIQQVNSKFGFDVWNNGTNINQMNIAMTNFSWYIDPSSADPGYDFVLKFDMNGDGRLDRKELILGVIWQNRLRDGLFCHDCYFLMSRKLSALFTYLDCQNKGYLTSEEIWNKLPNLARNTTQYDIFASGNSQSIRTSCINDFIIKNGYAQEAAINKNEFISGVLLGYWQRQLTNLTVITDDSINLKNIRWSSNGMVDILVDQFNQLNAPAQ